MITQEKLIAALRRMSERTPCISDWRKLPTGRLVRFIAWSKAARSTK